MDNKCLCFNWEPSEKYNKWENIEIHDETLRDGLQSPSAEHPDIGSKIEILQSMSDMGIESVSIGFPASSHRIYKRLFRRNVIIFVEDKRYSSLLYSKDIGVK